MWCKCHVHNVQPPRHVPVQGGILGRPPKLPAQEGVHHGH